MARRVTVLTAAEAAGMVEDGDVVAVSGCVWSLVPERIVAALEERFLRTGSPRDLTENHLHVYGIAEDQGLEHFAHAGMTKRVVGGSFAPPYWFKNSRMARLIHDDEIEAFIVPAGVVAAQWRAQGAGRPGVLTRIGWQTFVDPRHGGGAITTAASSADFRTSEVVDVAGDEWLFYPAMPIDVSLIRATAADEEGNLTFHEEPVHQSALAQAMAAKASGGRVFAQVKHLVPANSLDARLVRIPSLLVDAVVVAPDQQQLEYGIHDDSPAFIGAQRLPAPPPRSPRPMHAERWVAWRAVQEVEPGMVVNIGAGLPVVEIPDVLRLAELDEQINLTVEHGSLGGANLGGQLCQTHWNPTAIIDSNQTFDFYTGGGLDVAFLGMAQVDGAGNVNVAKVGDSVAGVGGFMDIAQSASKVVFCGTLRHGGGEATFVDGQLQINREGRNPKFVPEVPLVCFHAGSARPGQEVLYLTERALFRFEDGGLTLIEIAPGVDLERDVRAQVECDFAVSPDLHTMSVPQGARDG